MSSSVSICSCKDFEPFEMKVCSDSVLVQHLSGIKAHCHIHKSMLMVPMLSQENTVHTLSPDFLRIHFIEKRKRDKTKLHRLLGDSKITRKDLVFKNNCRLHLHCNCFPYKGIICMKERILKAYKNCNLLDLLQNLTFKN